MATFLSQQPTSVFDLHRIEKYDEIYDMLLNKLSTNDHYITHIFKFCFDRLETIKKIKTTISVNTSK